MIPFSKLVSLETKRAMVTGSGAGIGEAIAIRLAEAGADLELVESMKKAYLKTGEDPFFELKLRSQ